MDYVTARLHRPHHREPAQHVHVPAAATTARSSATAYDDELVKLAGVDADPPAAARRDRRRAIGTLLARRRARARPARVGDRVRGDERHRDGRGRDRRVRRRAGPGISIGTTSVLVDEVDDFRVDLEHQIFSMPGAVSPTATSCARRTASAARCSSTCCATSSTRDDELGDHRADDPFARARRACSARPTAGAGGVMFLPWLGGRERAAERRRDARRLREHVARDRRGATSCARSSKASRTTSRWLLAARRGVHRQRDRRDRVRRRRGPVRARGARSSPTCSTGP